MGEVRQETDELHPVRVLHLISELRDGGSERWLEDIVRLSEPELVTHQVVTIYPNYDGDAIYANGLRALGAYRQPASNPVLESWRRVIKGIRALRDRLPARKLLSLPLRLGADGLAMGRIVRALIEFRPDVIHAHTLPEFIPGVLIRMTLGKPLIHTVPCLFSQMADADYDWMPWFYSWLHPWVDLFSIGEAREELISVGVPESKLIYDRCGANLQEVEAARVQAHRHRVEVRRSLGIQENSPLTLSVGRLHRTKGHLFTVEALPSLLDRFPDLHALILGEGQERVALQSRARELRVDRHIHLAGFQPSPLPYYAAADIYLRTTTLEPENLSFYQAVAMGLPVVGFDTGWESDPVSKTNNGILLPRKDPKALAEAIAQLLELPDHGRSMGERGTVFAREHLDLRKSVSQLCSTYLALSRQ